jgi:tetratricopeptide (TPR) repeat protein
MKRIRNSWKFRFLLCISLVLLIAASAAAEGNPYDKAVNAYMKKDYKTAIPYLKEYVEKNADPYAYYLLGYAYYELKNHAASVKYFKEAYTLDPNISYLSVKKHISAKSKK